MPQPPELLRNERSVRELSRHSEPEFGIWGYASLHSAQAGHFATPHFAVHHTLSVLARDATEITLVFCPHSRKQTGLEGTLRLGADTTFVGARWTYWNAHRRRESAGGEVTFNPPGLTAFGARAPLLAASGLFWRKLATAAAGSVGRSTVGGFSRPADAPRRALTRRLPARSRPADCR